MNFARCLAYAQSLIMPSYCPYCRTILYEKTIFCNKCQAYIQPIVSTVLPITKKYSMNIFAVSGYQEPVKSLVLAKHWSDYYASIQLGQLIWERSCLSSLSFDYLIPIPLHWRRYAHRGYNQTELIANTLSSLSGKPVLNILQRTKATPFQSSLPIENRSANVHNAFCISNNVPCLKDKNILLVDDLMTTGATLKNSGSLFIPFNPNSINAIVACRVL